MHEYVCDTHETRHMDVIALSPHECSISLEIIYWGREGVGVLGLNMP